MQLHAGAWPDGTNRTRTRDYVLMYLQDAAAKRPYNQRLRFPSHQDVSNEDHRECDESHFCENVYGSNKSPSEKLPMLSAWIWRLKRVGRDDRYSLQNPSIESPTWPIDYQYDIECIKA